MPRSGWPIIVGGCHRSGTSVVRRALDAHPRIHCGPEVTFFRDFYGDYFDDPLRHLRFATTARSLLPEDELLEVLGRGFMDAHARAARRAGKPRWADKAPDNVLYTREWTRLLGEQWLLVHVVRNPLDTLASMHEARFPLTFPLDLAERAGFYRRYTEAGLRFGQEHPDRYLRVVYEELCSSPERVLRNLMNWIGESFVPAQLVFNARPRTSGLEDPKVDATEEIHSHSLHRWRSVFSTSEARDAWAETADVWARIDPQGRMIALPPDEQ